VGSEPPSGAALAVALGRGEEAGLLAVLDAYGPDLLDYAEFLLASRPSADDTHAHLADEAAGAVRDALLAATGAVADLTDRQRMLPWLLALTRNECLRRRPGSGGPSATEAAELGRRGLRPLEVGALLGFAPAALPRRIAPVQTPPAWLRAELVAAAGPGGDARRSELTRRARPFEADGFPVPLDRRRLSRKVLAWSAAVVVVIAAGLLVALPAKGSAGPTEVQPAALAASASTPPAATAEAADPGPSLGAAPFGSASVPTAAPETDAGTTPVPPARTAASSPAPAPRPEAQAGTADRRSRSAGIELSWSPAAGLACGGQWTAHLHATTGGVEVASVVAVASRGGTVRLQRDGDGWSGDLAGLPTDRTVTVTVYADGPVRPAWARLRPDC
jgi:hypothetical protein